MGNPCSAVAVTKGLHGIEIGLCNHLYLPAYLPTWLPPGVHVLVIVCTLLWYILVMGKCGNLVHAVAKMEGLHDVQIG